MKSTIQSLQINDKIKDCLIGDPDKEKKRLERNILEDGRIFDAILIWGKVIIDGHQRYKIALKHDLPFATEELQFENEEAAIKYRARKQLEKRNSTPFQRAAIAIKLFKAEVEKEAKLRMKAGKQDPVLNSTQGSTRQKLAEIAGVGTDTIRKVQEILEYSSEDTVRKAEKGKITIHKAYKEVYNRLRRIEFEKIDEKIDELAYPDGLFDVIVVDPPWEMAKLPYPFMTLDEIKKIYIPAKDTAIIYLWTVHKYLSDAFDILVELGFDYKHTFVWDKQSKGRGYYARETVEFCLLGVKGKPKYLNETYTDIISERKGPHSQKPAAFYKMVKDVTNGRRLDMFSRKHHDGFEAWGAEADKYKESLPGSQEANSTED